MNDLDLCLEVVSRSRQPLRYIWRWISRKLLEKRLGSKGPPIAYGSKIKSPCRYLLVYCEAVSSAILATAWLLVCVVLSYSMCLVLSLSLFCCCILLSGVVKPTVIYQTLHWCRIAVVASFTITSFHNAVTKILNNFPAYFCIYTHNWTVLIRLPKQRNCVENGVCLAIFYPYDISAKIRRAWLFSDRFQFVWKFDIVEKYLVIGNEARQS